MPSSSFSSSEKSHIKAALPSSAYKIITATPVRVYAAYPSPDVWTYTGKEGALALVRDNKSCFFFKLVDAKVGLKARRNSYAEQRCPDLGA